MQYIQQIAFVLLAGVAIQFFVRKLADIRRNILLGKDENFSDRKPERWKNLVLLALGQKKMFRNPLVALMHLVIYAGFIIINLEVLEIFLDGVLGTHRLFARFSPKYYAYLINGFELLAVGVILVCVIFLARRNIIRLKRFASKDLNGWPRSDANLILVTEIVLMFLFLFMNASDTLLQKRFYPGFQSHPTGDFVFSGMLQPMINGMSSSSLVLFERSAWWLHILGIFAFLNYLPWSKHLHILLAFPNAYFARLDSMEK